MMKEQREHDAKIRADETKKRDAQMEEMKRQHQEVMDKMARRRKKKGCAVM